MNTHTLESASPPANTAEAKERAGLTLVPVKYIPKICTKVSVRPITRPATLEFSSLEVTPKIANTNTKVSTISTTSDLTMSPSNNPLAPKLQDHQAK